MRCCEKIWADELGQQPVRFPQQTQLPKFPEAWKPQIHKIWFIGHQPRSDEFCLGRRAVRAQRSVSAERAQVKESATPSPNQAEFLFASQAAWYRMENGPKSKNGQKLAKKQKMALGPKWEKMAPQWAKNGIWGHFSNLFAIFGLFFPIFGFRPVFHSTILAKISTK